ncbi:MAG: bifunctional glutamate N-acetyltransferase/amino-acid acetyltransferase ArgJ [Gammaproteobacteria bacterium]|nr:bifunctional glutamate N-acetyltransferase/amino-acid acetyltransferase ArgJ [Gammaproteobacteria bacterium]
MSVGLKQPEKINPVAGVKLSATHAGLRKTNAADLLLIELAAGSRVAVTLTKNLFCAAPIIVVQEHIKCNPPRYLIINAGNANAGTGNKGLLDAKECCRYLSESTGVQEREILPFSTGVIGKPLDVKKIKVAIPALLQALEADAWLKAARAIMTTDTLPKAISRSVRTGDTVITITGIAKGAGMICPNMATMLSFIATDADIEQTELETLHKKLVAASFNRISVDGDTSTNDACVCISTAQKEKIYPGTPLWQEFEQAMLEVYQHLAQAIIRDGEGAGKFITIKVINGHTETDCEAVARAVAHSPLVKTALFASDANWGRILAAVGRAGVRLDIDQVKMTINDVLIFYNGQLADDYTEASGSAAVAQDEIVIEISLGCGVAEYLMWTTDLGHEYVRINAEYRT